ncbi:MAG: LapA family protein [Acidobacteriota bacterium]|jgi:uncharacterized integral membrane protein
MNAIFKMLLYLALVILLVAVAYANADQQVDVTFFPGRTLVDVPVFLVILGSVFIGVLVAGIIAVIEHFKHGMRERELQRRIGALETEVRELRNLPIGSGLSEADDGDAGWPQE